MPKREITGTVVSKKMQKTVVVSVQEQHPHAKYGKYQVRTVKFKAHDELDESREGDVVLIEECRPISKDKTWRLKRILQRAEAV